MLYFTAPLIDCDDPAVLLSLYHSTNQTAKNDCSTEEWRRSAARIYFAGCILNALLIISSTVLFIFCASGSSASATHSRTQSATKTGIREVQQTARKQSLGKRSIAATTLGAFGHLVFSTTHFLNQTLNNDIGCQLSLWGVLLGFYTWLVAIGIRAYRLRFLYKLNRLRVKYLRMSREERLAYVTDKDYHWYIKCSQQKKCYLLMPYALYGASVCVIVIVTVPTELASMKANGACYFSWGTITLICMYAFFLCVMAPLMLWVLRHVSDAHGIRKEIWADVLISIPFFVVYTIRFIVIGGGQLSLVLDSMKIAGPGLFAVFFTMIAHFISVVLPVIEYLLPINGRRFWKRLRANLRKWTCRETQRKLSHSSDTPSSSLQHQIDTQELPVIIPELSIDSLELVLADPEMMEQLQTLAIKDFSSENVIFYEKYLMLQEVVKNRILLNRPLEPPSFGPKKLISALAPATTPFKGSSNKTSDDTEKFVGTASTSKDTKHMSLTEFLSYPVPYDLYPLFIRFYEGFIRNGATDQVNISYRARRKIDETFSTVYEEYPELKEFIQVPQPSYGVGSSLTFHNNSGIPCGGKQAHQPALNRSTIYFDQNDTPHDDAKTSSTVILNLNIFESARIEVCWNIFSSIYPKLVDMYAPLRNNDSGLL